MTLGSNHPEKMNVFPDRQDGWSRLPLWGKLLILIPTCILLLGVIAAVVTSPPEVSPQDEAAAIALVVQHNSPSTALVARGVHSSSIRWHATPMSSDSPLKDMSAAWGGCSHCFTVIYKAETDEGDTDAAFDVNLDTKGIWRHQDARLLFRWTD
jgi:hypothetical protein